MMELVARGQKPGEAGGRARVAKDPNISQGSERGNPLTSAIEVLPVIYIPNATGQLVTRASLLW